MFKRQLWYTVDGNVNWYSHFSLLDIYPKNLKPGYQRGTGTPMSIAAIFMVKI